MYSNRIPAPINTSIPIVSVISKVIDIATGKPVSNVNIFVQGRPTTGTATDANGNFQLNALITDTLVFSHQTYETETMLVNSVQQTVYMVEGANQLDEVVITNTPKKSRAGLYIIGAIIGAFALYSVTTMDE
ncbi:carboxypeptidase-like regulatory domain-containing protein [Bizionia myxarmorum]|uniref:Carboxypeptidase-like regulatory domain-containing protein n=1 Tax=Bizionia myxarmorum TaxID=291186 RepID=A0A5D0RBR9_9FLAO|nr:carboxypeptidase-like regulatory domain-containing protein [Bizionia myxarmorum]TYB78336.1 hypothetical protein ES674_00720 [Bizionia myxarmorum]